MAHDVNTNVHRELLLMALSWTCHYTNNREWGRVDIVTWNTQPNLQASKTLPVICSTASSNCCVLPCLLLLTYPSCDILIPLYTCDNIQMYHAVFPSRKVLVFTSVILCPMNSVVDCSYHRSVSSVWLIQLNIAISILHKNTFIIYCFLFVNKLNIAISMLHKTHVLFIAFCLSTN